MPRKLSKPLDEEVSFRKAYGYMEALDNLKRNDLLEKLGFYDVGNPLGIEHLKKEPTFIFMDNFD